MAKRLMVKVGSYEKEGQQKGEYVKVGVILENQNGEYALLDPAVNMAGIMLKQQVNGIAKAGSDSVIASIFTDEQNAPQKAADMSKANQSKDFDDDLPY